jgi:sugar phosphate isomerase/epimerase
MYGAQASANLGLTAHATFSGSLMWHTFHPWPQRPDGLVDAGFTELAKRWMPILNRFDECGVDVCYEVHPGEDIFDGETYEMFLNKVNNHKRACLLYDPSHFVLQQLDYIQYIDHYHERIKAFHVKDAEFNKTGKQGTFGGYQSWANRAGRYRSPGDGQVDFKTIFSKLAQYNYTGWAVMEWECCIKHPEVGAAEGFEFIKRNIIQVTDRAFDDFAGANTDDAFNKKVLGIK